MPLSDKLGYMFFSILVSSLALSSQQVPEETCNSGHSHIMALYLRGGSKSSVKRRKEAERRKKHFQNLRKSANLEDETCVEHVVFV